MGAGKSFEDPLLFALLFLETLGVPLTWRKVRGGVEVEWVGLLLDVRHFRLGLSERRLAWAKEWCEKWRTQPSSPLKRCKKA